MRRAAALVITPLLGALALAGCGSSSSSPNAASSSNTAAADTYTSVTATGTFGKAPTVTIPAETGSGPLLAKTVIQGTGAALTSAEGLVGNYVVYDWTGKTHKLLGSSFTQGKPSLFTGALLPGLETALIGQKIGSRVLAVIPPADGFGTNGNSEAGIGKTDTLVFVIDMLSEFGQNTVPGTQTTNGGGSLPTITAPAAASTAGPTIAIPAKAKPSAKLQAIPLIKGTGAKVAAGDNLVVNYTGVNWRTGKVFDSSWARKQAYTVVIGAGQVITGWDTGLVGQTVGSRMLLVIPPADAYEKQGGQPSAGIKATDSLVFVVDILAAN